MRGHCRQPGRELVAPTPRPHSKCPAARNKTDDAAVFPLELSLEAPSDHPAVYLLNLTERAICHQIFHPTYRAVAR